MKRQFFIVLLITIQQTSLGQWQVVDFDAGCQYHAVFFLNDSVGFVVGTCNDQSVIKKTIDFGETWNITHEVEGDYFYDVFFSSDSIGYVSSHSNVLKTQDQGESWAYPNPDFIGYPYRSILFENDDTGFGCFADGGAVFAMTTDGGFSWEENTDFGGREIIGVSSCDHRMISGFYTITDNCWEDNIAEVLPIDGRTDENMAYSQGIALTCGIGLDETLDNFGFIGRSINEGETWDYLDFSSHFALRSIQFASPSVAYCVGLPDYPNQMSFLKTEDAGLTWGYQEYELPCDDCYSPQVIDLYCPSENVCFAISTSGAIFATSNGGGDITPLTSTEEHPFRPLINVYPIPATNKIFFSTSSNSPVLNGRVYNSLGVLIESFSLPSRNQEMFELDVSSFSAGQYFLVCEGLDVGASKFIIE